MNNDRSGFEIKSIKTNEIMDVIGEYEAWHQRGRMILTEKIKLHVRRGQGASTALEITGCLKPTPDESLDELAEWLERISIAIKNRKKPELNIPIYL